MAKKKPNMQHRNAPTSTQKVVSEILASQPTELAALAWAGYLAEGRGFILVMFEKDEINAEYHGTKGSFWKETGIGEMIPELKLSIEKYDPKTEIVVITYKNDGGEISTFGKLPVPPPLAYEKVMAE